MEQALKISDKEFVLTHKGKVFCDDEGKPITFEFGKPFTIKVGKRKFARVIVEDKEKE